MKGHDGKLIIASFQNLKVWPVGWISKNANNSAIYNGNHNWNKFFDRKKSVARDCDCYFCHCLIPQVCCTWYRKRPDWLGQLNVVGLWPCLCSQLAPLPLDRDGEHSIHTLSLPTDRVKWSPVLQHPLFI